jgi:ABC-2 type transport system permease protein
VSSFSALLKKELLEIGGYRHSRYGVGFQGAVFVVLLGVFVPARNVSSFLGGDPASALFYAFLPGVLASSIAADAFAGERERQTLETLLATPLSERVILWGKLSAAVLFGMATAALGLAATVATVNAAAGPWLPPLALLGASLGAALASALLMSSVAIVVSTMTPVARAAHSISWMGSVAILSLGFAAWRWLGLAVSWRNVLGAEACCALLALAILDAARILFRRERFFETS